MLKQLKSSVFLGLFFLISTATQSSASILLEWDGIVLPDAYCSPQSMSRAGLGNGLILLGSAQRMTDIGTQAGACSWREQNDPVDADWSATERSILFKFDGGWPMTYLTPEFAAVSDAGTLLGNDMTAILWPVGVDASTWSSYEAWLKKADGTLLKLPVLSSAVGSSRSEQAMDMSVDGSVVIGEAVLEQWVQLPRGGWYQGAFWRQAFRWTQASGMQGLGYLPGGSSDPGSSANSISADGTVVAGWSSSTDGVQAFRWTTETGMVGLGDLAGGAFYSKAKDVSGNGAAVVGFSQSALGQEAFRWTEATGMVGLGDLPDGDFHSEAIAVSADGVLVVGNSLSRCVSGSCSSSNKTHYMPFIWIYGIGMISMQDYLTLLGIDLTGWTLYTVIGISDDGQTIVGNGRFNGQDRVWIASRVEEAQPSDILNPLSVENPVVLPPADTTLPSDVSPQPSVADSVALTIVGIGEEPPAVTPPPPVEEPVVMTKGKRPRKVHAKRVRATRKKSRK